MYIMYIMQQIQVYSDIDLSLINSNLDTINSIIFFTFEQYVQNLRHGNMNCHNLPMVIDTCIIIWYIEKVESIIQSLLILISCDSLKVICRWPVWNAFVFAFTL